MELPCYDAMHDIWSRLSPLGKAAESHNPRSLYCFKLLKTLGGGDWIDDLAPYANRIPSTTLQDNHYYKDLVKVGWDPVFVEEILRYKTGFPLTEMSFIEPREHFWTPSLIREFGVRGVCRDHYCIADLSVGRHHERLLIPVVRYQREGGSLFYGVKPAHVCGVFYYYEPDSGYYLSSWSTLVADNKFDAMLLLGWSIERIIDLYAHAPSSPSTTVARLKAGKGDYLLGLLITYSPSFPVDRTKSGRENLRAVILAMTNPSRDKTKYYPWMYAFEDELDQPLCKVARKQAIDCVILKYMAVHTRNTTEVLDTRSTQISYDNVLFPPFFD
jgi:hypothetical protein